jgi:predicted MFS family arabinose efflux permease
VLLGARFLTALVTGAFWALANVVATRTAGPAASSRTLGLVGAGAMLTNIIGVPLARARASSSSWRGPLWALAVLAGPGRRFDVPG